MLDQKIKQMYFIIGCKLVQLDRIDYIPPLLVTTGAYKGECDLEVDEKNKVIKCLQIRISKRRKENIENTKELELTIVHEFAHMFVYEHDNRHQQIINIFLNDLGGLIYE